jgi:hypothetical protein
MQLSNSCNAITCSRLSHVRGCDILHAQAKQCLQKISLLRTQLFPSQSLLLPYRQPGLQASALPNMNFTVALTTAIHYAHANPGTIAIATGSAAVVACPALLSVAAFSAAGLASNGPVAGDLPLPHFHFDDSKSDRCSGGAFALLQSTIGGTPALAAILQSAAMGGYGVAIVNGVVQTGGAIAGLATVAHAVR